MKRSAFFGLFLAALCVAVDANAATTNFGPRSKKTVETRDERKSAEPRQSASATIPVTVVAEPAPAPVFTGNPKVRIETTAGTIEAELFAKEVPKTVENFVTLAKKGFYDGIVFHRVIPGFMIQTGDPTGTGTGDAGYKFGDEFSASLKHDAPGVLSMANSGPNTNGSQFFITDAATPWLDGRHSVFGRVTGGLDVVKKIATAERDSSDKPRTEIKMTKVTVTGA